MAIDKGDVFKCARCGETFIAETPADEVRDEMEGLFGKIGDSCPVVTICDDCFKIVVPWASEVGRAG